VIVPGKDVLVSYDLETGEIVWQSAGLTMNAIPSPVFGDGMVFATAGFQGNNLKAIRLEGARGDITGTPSIVWKSIAIHRMYPSPILYDGILYILRSNNGILSAFDANNGERALHGATTPRGSSECFCVTSRRCRTDLFSWPRGRHRRHFATARHLKYWPRTSWDDGFDASPALVDRESFLKGNKVYCYCIAAPVEGKNHEETVLLCFQSA
jgi:hypothetical protein